MGNTVKVLDNPEMKEKLKIAPETKEKLKIAPVQVILFQNLLFFYELPKLKIRQTKIPMCITQSYVIKSAP